MSSVWQDGNGAAEASANPFPLTVFQWLMQLSHTPQPHKTLDASSRAPAGLSFQDHFLYAEELKQECCALPPQCLFSQAGTGAYPDWNGHGRGAGYLGQGIRAAGFGLNTDGEEEDTGKARVRIKWNMTEACCCQQPCQGKSTERVRREITISKRWSMEGEERLLRITGRERHENKFSLEGWIGGLGASGEKSHKWVNDKPERQRKWDLVDVGGGKGIVYLKSCHLFSVKITEQINHRIIGAGKSL